MSRDLLVKYGKVSGGARKRTPKIKPEPPIRHSAECEAAWSAYQTALRRHGVTMDGYNPSTVGPVATARGAYVKAARSCNY